MIAFWLIWFPFFIAILAFLFCRFCLSKYDWKINREIPYKMRLWVFILYLIWALIPFINYGCIVIIMIAFIDSGYSVKSSIIDFFTNNKYVNFLNKEI